MSVGLASFSGSVSIYSVYCIYILHSVVHTIWALHCGKNIVCIHIVNNVYICAIRYIHSA